MVFLHLPKRLKKIARSRGRAANGLFSEYILSTLFRQQKTTAAETAKQLPERVRKAMNNTWIRYSCIEWE